MKNTFYVLVLALLFAGCKKDKPLIACFDFTPNNALAQTEITFTNCSDIATEYRWDFGDGSGTSILASPTYRYSQPGTYQVKLTVSGNGKSTSTTKSVVVSGCPDGYEGPGCGTPEYAKFIGTYDVNEIFTITGGPNDTFQYVINVRGYSAPKSIYVQNFGGYNTSTDIAGNLNGHLVSFVPFSAGTASISGGTGEFSGDTLRYTYSFIDQGGVSGQGVAIGIRR